MAAAQVDCPCYACMRVCTGMAVVYDLALVGLMVGSTCNVCFVGLRMARRRSRSTLILDTIP